PAGDVDVTAALAGYSFSTVSVNVTAGETRTLNITAMGTIQATNVTGERDTGTDGTYDGNVTVTWEAGGAGSTGVTYAAQWCIVGDDPAETCDADDARWGTNLNIGVWAAGLTVTGEAPADGDFMVRVMASTDDVSLTSEAATVDAIDVSPSDAAAERDIGVDRFALTVNWNGARAATGTSGRIIASFNEGETWVELAADAFSTGYTAGGDGDRDHEYTFQLESATAKVVNGDDGTDVVDDPATADVDESELAVSNTDLEGAFMIRVQMRHDGVDVSDDDTPVDIWKASKNAGVDAS
ncbi:MAG: hypothetical protein OXC29_18545, partial [Rhodococcus sp.]|nr:hypothetical protein [Rhodococcus sp. (in: high G+C Gram-positive bacteria)]